MTKKSRLLIILCFIITITSIEGSKKKAEKKVETSMPATTLTDGPITIFIHGTVFPVISHFTHGAGYPDGLIWLKECLDKNPLTRVAHTLVQAAPEEFSLNSFYLYCWPGELRFDQRKKATEKLLIPLSKHKGPVTIIAHSHGCNVALYLAELAGADDSLTFSIDTLILLACPVQLATAHLIYSPLFKRIYSFYSTADFIQTLDPQGLYNETKKQNDSKRGPFFSRRTFHDSPHLIQARVLINRQNPGHMSFIQPRFLKKLPAMLDMLTKAALEKDKRHFIINVPHGSDKPFLADSVKAVYKKQ